jgi:hypothetical protein
MKKGIRGWGSGIRDEDEYLQRISGFKIVIQWSLDDCSWFGIWGFETWDLEL